MIDSAQIKQKNNEWYTPSKYIEAARTVMGGIDLDPASCELANQTVKATKYFSKEENGLAQEWYGRIWLNPPYGRFNDENAGYSSGRRLGGGKSISALFIDRLLKAYQAMYVEQAILLVTSDTDAAWFIPLWNYPICFADHRVLFHRPGLENQGQFFGTCFAYLGPNEQKFIEEFSQFGTIAKRVSQPRKEAATHLSLLEVS